MGSDLFLLRHLGAPVRFLAQAVVWLRLPQWSLLAYSFSFQYPGKKGDVYNLLWVLVFGFATLNILGLGARRLDPQHNRLSFGELLAIMVVVGSLFLISWEMLNLFKIFPIKLRPH